MTIQTAPADYELSLEGDIWVATHVQTGIASQGSDPNEAVAMAQEAVELSQQDHELASKEDQEALRRELGIDTDPDEPPIDSPDGMP